jgi:dihydroflavonol-4-reductase
MSRYLVTGASGFLGRHLVDALRARGDEVIALARHAPSDLGTGVRVVRGDVLDAASVQRALEGCEGVFHCAGKVSRDPRDAEELWRVHVVGTRNVLEAARAAGVRRVVLASTSGTVGISEEPTRVATEDSPTPHALIQRFPYYRAKLFAEQEALAASREGFEVVSVNPSLLLGPGDVYGSSTGDVRLFLDRAVPAIPAGGMAYVDARDAAEALLLAMARGRAGRRYLINASNVTVREFFARLERVSGVPGPRLAMPRSRTLVRSGTALLGRLVAFAGGELPVDPVSVEMAQLYWYVDASRAERELGWTPRDPIETLADTVRALRHER